MVYTANWGIICHLPPFRGTRKIHWNEGAEKKCIKINAFGNKLIEKTGVELTDFTATEGEADDVDAEDAEASEEEEDDDEVAETDEVQLSWLFANGTIGASGCFFFFRNWRLFTLFHIDRSVRDNLHAIAVLSLQRSSGAAMELSMLSGFLGAVPGVSFTSFYSSMGFIIDRCKDSSWSHDAENSSLWNPDGHGRKVQQYIF